MSGDSLVISVLCKDAKGSSEATFPVRSGFVWIVELGRPTMISSCSASSAYEAYCGNLGISIFATASETPGSLGARVEGVFSSEVPLPLVACGAILIPVMSSIES